MTAKLYPPFDAIAESQAKLVAAQAEGRTDAFAAIRLMLVALRDAMHKSAVFRLRGMPNLATTALPCRALLVRAQRADKAIPFPRVRGSDDWGQEVLVLTEIGGLCYARRNDRGDVELRDIFELDGDLLGVPVGLKAEDVEHVAETIEEALQRHLEQVDRRVDEYQDLSQLSRRIRGALEGGA